MQIMGTRKFALMGSLLLGGGIVFSGFVSHNVPGLFMLTGVMEGYGVSCCFLVWNFHYVLFVVFMALTGTHRLFQLFRHSILPRREALQQGMDNQQLFLGLLSDS
jgi:hypothetical protein